MNQFDCFNRIINDVILGEMNNLPAVSLEPAVSLPVFLLTSRSLMPSAVVTLQGDLSLPAEDSEVDPVSASLIYHNAELWNRSNSGF